MKIGILTFHWCYNYGAVIQAWALQTYLSDCGHEVVIVNYEPTRTRLPWWVIALRKNSWRQFVRDMHFHAFRRRRLNETIAVSSVSDIAALEFDAVIVGSDQVWNLQYFTGPNGKFNDVYFLCGDLGKTKKLTYAASIGHGDWQNYSWKDELLLAVCSFNSISVREEIAHGELAVCNIKSMVVPDPTLLLETYVYDRIKAKLPKRSPYIFSYLLSEYDRVRPLVNEVSRILQIPSYIASISHLCDSKVAFFAPDKWLSALRHADYVITDSFHGTALSIVFNVPFVTILKPDKPAMNARITGLLADVGLDERIAVTSSDILRIKELPIDWNKVNIHLESLRSIGRDWLSKFLSV